MHLNCQNAIHSLCRFAPRSADSQSNQEKPDTLTVNDQAQNAELPAQIVTELHPAVDLHEKSPAEQTTAKVPAIAQEEGGVAKSIAKLDSAAAAQADLPASASATTLADAGASAAAKHVASSDVPVATMAKPGTPAATVAAAPIFRENLDALPATQLAATTPSSGKTQKSNSAIQGAAGVAHGNEGKAKKVEKDGDVELIAALLNRVSAKGEPAAEERVRKSAPSTQRDSSIDQKKNRKAGNLRESLAQKPVDTTDTQLKRCGSLGFFEGELCRFRVCNGRWGRDPACPDSAQLSVAAP